MGDALVTTSQELTRLPDLAYIADNHPLRTMRTHAVAGTVFAGEGHSCKLYYDQSWTSTEWRIYYCKWPTPAAPYVVTAPRGGFEGTWSAETPLSVPALQSWEAADYGIGSLCLVRTPGGPGANLKAYYQYHHTDGTYRTGRMDTVDGLTFTNKQQVTFDSQLAGYPLVGIVSATWDEVRKVIVAAAHVYLPNTSRFYGAIVESTDGVSFATRSLLLDPGYDHGGGTGGDLFDLHWIGRVGTTYAIMWTTQRATQSPVGSIQTGLGFSVDLDNWYVPPELAWPYIPGNEPIRYPAFTYIDGNYYVAGTNVGTNGFKRAVIPPS